MRNVAFVYEVKSLFSIKRLFHIQLRTRVVMTNGYTHVVCRIEDKATRSQ